MTPVSFSHVKWYPCIKVTSYDISIIQSVQRIPLYQSDFIWYRYHSVMSKDTPVSIWLHMIPVSFRQLVQRIPLYQSDIIWYQCHLASSKDTAVSMWLHMIPVSFSQAKGYCCIKVTPYDTSIIQSCQRTPLYQSDFIWYKCHSVKLRDTAVSKWLHMISVSFRQLVQRIHLYQSDLIWYQYHSGS